MLSKNLVFNNYFFDYTFDMIITYYTKLNKKKEYVYFKNMIFLKRSLSDITIYWIQTILHFYFYL